MSECDKRQTYGARWVKEYREMLDRWQVSFRPEKFRGSRNGYANDGYVRILFFY
jgi:hypothetical protein